MLAPELKTAFRSLQESLQSSTMRKKHS